MKNDTVNKNISKNILKRENPSVYNNDLKSSKLFNQNLISLIYMRLKYIYIFTHKYV